MGPLPAAVERCINSSYQYMQKARADIKRVTQQYRGLIPKAETFIFNNGSSKELVCLDGTIPVRYKNVTYNIPIRIWVLDIHPYHAPFCYVCPTPTMQIKTSQYVDESGRVYLPYLHDWNRNSSDLIGVIQVMIMIFGEQPPVFSKSPNAPGSSRPAQSKPQSTPYPSSTGMSVAFPMPTPGGTAMYPNSTPSYNPNYNSNNNNTLSITDQHIRISLLSAVESRITDRALEFEQKSKAEEEVLRKTNEELQAGKQKLDRYMSDMERDCREMESNLTVLKEKSEQLKQSIEQMSWDSEKGGLDVDNAVTPTAPLYRQLLQAYAEESAVEDAIYYLGEGLRKGVIDLDTFLKHVREQSRKQFMLRALMQKCRQKAGLPPV
ncbi:tumor susceptibility gene 101 protein-like isoform X1 [Varroa jacobsoni]|uniref:Tumor susceptibility gene 101 protein n=2 Tax=Varroa destructor TaxID=109461 RepID=A0A7M7KA97_VARDE|nr:tumor susceptibility gene 101 protein-like isoform X1 [Varroa destructor]XP_022691627.1 tumor susceptibility gene 101 protein-like isoform X1 [Varroa jacobsoni]